MPGEWDKCLRNPSLVTRGARWRRFSLWGKRRAHGASFFPLREVELRWSLLFLSKGNEASIELPFSLWGNRSSHGAPAGGQQPAALCSPGQPRQPGLRLSLCSLSFVLALLYVRSPCASPPRLGFPRLGPGPGLRSRCSGLASPAGSWKMATAAPATKGREKLFAWGKKTKVAKQSRIALRREASKIPIERAQSPLGPGPSHTARALKNQQPFGGIKLRIVEQAGIKSHSTTTWKHVLIVFVKSDFVLCLSSLILALYSLISKILLFSSSIRWF